MDSTKLILELTSDLPRFPDGRFDYTKTRKAPVLNCAVYSGGKLLVLKRSENVIAYPGVWNGISGFIDTLDPIEEIARWELREESGIEDHQIASVEVLEPHNFDDPSIGRNWVVFPVKVLLNTGPVIRLNEEHTDFKWVDPAEVGDLELLPDFINVVKRTIKQ